MQEVEEMGVAVLTAHLFQADVMNDFQAGISDVLERCRLNLLDYSCLIYLVKVNFIT